MFLLIDKGKEAQLRPHAEQYVLFAKFEECLAEADRRGYGGTGCWGDSFLGEPKLGMMMNYTAEDIDISFMRMEVPREEGADGG